MDYSKATAVVGTANRASKFGGNPYIN